VYIREGAIVPMDIKRDYTRIGDKNSEGFLTLLIYPDTKNEFTVFHPDKSGTTTVMVENRPEKINISLSDIHKSHILYINMKAKPERVELDNVILSDTVDYNFDDSRSKLIIKTDRYINGKYTIYY
jgi:alpha-glucosidase (family GH31 glycosyl hydrolase)